MAVAVSVVFLTNREYLTLEYRLSSATDGHLESLSPLADYLRPALESGDYVLLAARSDVLSVSMARHKIENDPKEAFSLLDDDLLKKACEDSGILSGKSPVSEYCESAVLESPPRNSDTYDCSAFRFPDVRKDCREKNDLLFSITSDSHCSKSDCMVDNAVYRGAVTKSVACSEIHPSLKTECLGVAEKYAEYVKNPASYSQKNLEDALSGHTENPLLLAARSAVLEFPDSPSSACEKFSASEKPKCETFSKELFSYVQKRGLRNRFERISKAVADYGKTLGTTPEPTR